MKKIKKKINYNDSVVSNARLIITNICLAVESVVYAVGMFFPYFHPDIVWATGEPSGPVSAWKIFSLPWMSLVAMSLVFIFSIVGVFFKTKFPKTIFICILFCSECILHSFKLWRLLPVVEKGYSLLQVGFFVLPAAYIALFITLYWQEKELFYWDLKPFPARSHPFHKP